MLLCSYLNSVLVSLNTYAITKVIVKITYLAFLNRWWIVQHAIRFSDKWNYCGVGEKNWKLEYLNFGRPILQRIEPSNSLREKCQNREFFLVRIFPYLDWIRENTDQKKLCIWTFFEQWFFVCYWLHCIINIMKNKSSMIWSQPKSAFQFFSLLDDFQPNFFINCSHEKKNMTFFKSLMK